MEAFAQFASDLDAATQQQLARGQRTVEILKQPQYQPMPVANQVAAIFAVTNGYLDEVEVDRVRAWERGFHDFLGTSGGEFLSGIANEGKLSDELEASLRGLIDEYNEIFKAEQSEAGAA